MQDTIVSEVKPHAHRVQLDTSVLQHQLHLFNAQSARSQIHYQHHAHHAKLVIFARAEQYLQTTLKIFVREEAIATGQHLQLAQRVLTMITLGKLPLPTALHAHLDITAF